MLQSLIQGGGGAGLNYVTIPHFKPEIETFNYDTNSFTYDANTTINIIDYLEGYDVDTVYIGGTLTAKEAGEYTTTFDLKATATHHWGDDSVGLKTITWHIAKQPVTAIPVVSDTQKTYNTQEQSPTIAEYDTGVFSVSGNKATNAGNYTVEFTLVDPDNYEWAEGVVTTASWNIAKAPGNAYINPSSISFTISSTTSTATITRSGDGKIIATSSNTHIATCSVTGTTLNVTGISEGTTNIVVNVAEGTNHLATSATISVTYTLPSKTLNNNTWAIISETAQAGRGDEFWDIGDAKQITLNGTIGGANTGSTTFTAQSLCVFILDFNHKMNGTADNNIIFGGFKTALTGGKDVVPTSFGINKTSITTNGWKGCDARYEALGNGTAKNTDATQDNIDNPTSNTIMSAIPSDMRAVVRLWSRWLDNTGGQSGSFSNKKGFTNANSTDKVTEVKDCCSLLAECEIFSERTNANLGEANYSTQMAYYAAGNNVVKYDISAKSTAVEWWESSPGGYGSNSSTYVWCHVSTSGTASGGNANFGGTASYTHGLAPAWKI